MIATRIFSSVEPVHSRRLNFRTNYDTFLRVVYRVIAPMNSLILGNWILKTLHGLRRIFRHSIIISIRTYMLKGCDAAVLRNLMNANAINSSSIFLTNEDSETFQMKYGNVKIYAKV